MKKFILITLFFFCQTISCQEYHFDYRSTYEYRLHENDTASARFITLGNSKTEGYLLRIIIEANKIVYESIIDFNKNLEFAIHSNQYPIENKDKLIFDEGRPLKIIDCDNYTNQYTVDYLKDGDDKVIKITRYKNKKKKKIINECIIHTKPTNITKNQHFSFPTLIFPLRCNKFKLENEEVLSEIHFIEHNKNLHFYKLIDFKSIELKIKI